MLITSIQFLLQHFLARMVLWLGVANQQLEGISWSDYFKKGKWVRGAQGIDFGWSHCLVGETVSFCW
jgi:hypothetical protein